MGEGQEQQLSSAQEHFKENSGHDSGFYGIPVHLRDYLLLREEMAVGTSVCFPFACLVFLEKKKTIHSVCYSWVYSSIWLIFPQRFAQNIFHLHSLAMCYLDNWVQADYCSMLLDFLSVYNGSVLGFYETAHHSFIYCLSCETSSLASPEPAYAFTDVFAFFYRHSSCSVWGNCVSVSAGRSCSARLGSDWRGAGTLQDEKLYIKVE